MSLGKSPFLPFEEGLATALQSMFDLYDRDRHGWAYQTWEPRVSEITARLLEIGVFEHYYIANAVRNLLISDFELYVIFIHFLAYAALNTPELTNWIHFRQWTTLEYPEIQSYVTSSSFVRYLIDMYGADLYLNVHFNPCNFENVYALSLQEMIQSWVAFLEINAKELLVLAQLYS